MSEFTEKGPARIQQLTAYLEGLIDGEDGRALLDRFEILTTPFERTDIVFALDAVLKSRPDMQQIKTASNKLFNILHDTLINLKKPGYNESPFLRALIKDNTGIRRRLEAIRPLVKQLNTDPDGGARTPLLHSFRDIAAFTCHYSAMQNIVFPEVEKRLEEHGCLKILWSFHDDIIHNTKRITELLEGNNCNLKEFNALVGKIFFNINTVIFREEEILFPIIHERFEQALYPVMTEQLPEFGLHYARIPEIPSDTMQSGPAAVGTIGLRTGTLDAGMLELIFGNLPVDITYVDENDEVRFFSDPPHRIFPRTPAIIGRKVQNCHPQESVHMVERILEAFKSGEQEEASFRIKLKGQYVLIRYIALRDTEGAYRGVLEVSQEISGIQALVGEKRLLDW